MSDNCAGAAPEIAAAVMSVLDGRARSYGSDDVTLAARATLRDLFDAPAADVFLVPTGTAANALALASVCPPWGAIYAAGSAHLDVDECGAPTFFTGGATLRLLDHADGLIDPAVLATALRRGRVGDVHAVQPAAISIAQISELGAAYTPRHVHALTDMAHDAGLFCHMDGARFANAVAHAGCAPADMTWRAGIDVLSLGATKNGALGAEAVVIFDPDLARDMGFRRKRAGHLLSKMRVMSTQIVTMFGSDLWLRLAGQANDAASRLAAGLAKVPGATVTNRVDGNMVFARLDADMDAALISAGARYARRSERDGSVRARLVTAFDTQSRDVDAFLDVARSRARP
ncbi:threonine aldolase family protein [Aquicoccus porphyridii]|nr:beta-eliminating lyase-related protein [Aquicoccus porphyridii]